MITRKKLAGPSDPDKQKFVDAVLDLKAEKTGNTNTYDKYVQWHKDTVDEATGREDAHMGPALFAWHRVFVLEFEKDLQRISGDPNFGLPYWDWTVDNSPTSSIWADTFMGGNGNGAPDWAVTTGQFRRGNWELRVRGTDPDTGKEEPAYLRRQFGANNLKLPTQADVQATLNATPFDVAPWNDKSASGFRNRAEGYIPEAGRPHMHNAVHNWVGGSMIPITSPNDPVFFLHHCFMDKLWADWQTSHPNESPYGPNSGAAPGHNLNDRLSPWTVTPAKVRTHHRLPDGYESYRYDYEIPKLTGLVHIAEKGDRTVWQYSFAGTRGQGLSLQGFEVYFDTPVEGLGMEYMAHLAETGDTPWYQGGKFVGTRGENRSLQGFAIRLTGTQSSNYDVGYMAHLAETGDTTFYTNGQFCGTRGEARGVQGIEVRVVPKIPYEPGIIIVD
jgi:hypothetical protein